MSALLLEVSDAHQVHSPTPAANPSRLLTVLRPVASGFPPDDDELELEQDDGEPQQDDDDPASEQDPSVRSTPPPVYEPPRPYGAAFYESDVNVTTCAGMHLHSWKTAPRGARITHLKFWGHGLQPKDVDPAQVLQVYFYAFWSDSTYTVEPRSTLLKCYRAKKLAEIQAKTCNAARTAVVGARAGVLAGVVVSGCCCGGSGSAGRCFGSCLLAGTSVPCSLRETNFSSSSLPVQQATSGAAPAATVQAAKPLPYQDTGGWCVLYALFNACHVLRRPIPKVLQAALRARLGPVSDLKNLGLVLHNKKLKSPVHLRQLKTLTLTGVTPLQWVLRQTAGLFLVADHAHCVAVDCRRQRVYDCAEEFPLPLALDVLSQQCRLDVRSGLLTVRAVVSSGRRR
jgi:hypothetical protein